MSISTSGGEQRRPNVVTVGGKPGDKSAAKSKPGAPAKGGKPGGSRKPITPVKVSQGRNWGPIVMYAVVGVLTVGIIGWGVWATMGPGNPNRPWQERAADIEGIQAINRADLGRNHKFGSLPYEQKPAVGGDHNDVWQQCSGNVYDAPIPNEHAVHSLEHGAVWVTYRSDLPADQVAALAKKIEGKDFTMMSPVEGLDSAVTLQAWGYQLRLGDVNDERIDTFINALRQNATMEPGAACSGGNTAVGATPLTQEQVQQQFGGGMEQQG